MIDKIYNKGTFYQCVRIEAIFPKEMPKKIYAISASKQLGKGGPHRCEPENFRPEF